MADFFFFTDVDLLNSQLAEQKFGPVVNFENSKYQLQSIHTSTSDSSAYAICDGQVFVQEDSDNSSLLNLVLKPNHQPKTGLPFIKYFIYKGIKKTSLLNSDGINVAPAVTNDLTQLIWNSQYNRNQSFDELNNNPPGTTTDNPSPNSLGINYSSTSATPYTAQNSTKLALPFFNNESDFQLPSVSGGFKIGTFDSTQFSLQIIFDTTISYDSFNFVRNFGHIINVPALIGGESQIEVFNHWQQKEQILNYLDPCAFYGCFYQDSLLVKESTDNDFNKVTGDDIYDQILSKFANRNRTYVDLRGELNHSFAYFGNYGTEIMVSFDGSSPTIMWDVRESHWPIIIIDNQFPVGNSLSHNTLKLRFPKGDIENPLLAIKTGSTKKTFPLNVNSSEVFVSLIHDNTSTFNLNVIELWTPNFQNNQTTPITSYLHLKYIRSLLTYNTTVPDNHQLIQKHGMDYVFYPFEMTIDGLESVDYTQIQIFHDDQFMDSSTNSAQSFLAFKGIGLDPDGTRTFFAFPTDKYLKTNIKSKRTTFSGGTYKDGRSSMVVIADLIDATYTRTAFIISNELVEFETLESNYLTTGDIVPSINHYNSSEIYFFSLTQDEYTELESIKNDSSYSFLAEYPISIAFKLIDGGLTSNYIDAYHFARFKVVLCGFKLDANSNSIIRNEVDSEIIKNRLYKPNQLHLIHS